MLGDIVVRFESPETEVHHFGGLIILERGLQDRTQALSEFFESLRGPHMVRDITKSPEYQALVYFAGREANAKCQMGDTPRQMEKRLELGESPLPGNVRGRSVEGMTGFTVNWLFEYDRNTHLVRQVYDVHFGFTSGEAYPDCRPDPLVFTPLDRDPVHNFRSKVLDTPERKFS